MSGQFTERAKKVLALAADEAERAGAAYVGVEHIMAAIVREANSDPSGPVAQLVAAWRAHQALKP